MKNMEIDQEVQTKSVQSFGYIIVCDLKGNIVGISNNFSEITANSSKLYLKQHIINFFERYLVSSTNRILRTIEEVLQRKTERRILHHDILGSKYYLHIYHANDSMYCEWEPQEKSTVKAFQMDTIAYLLEEKTPAIWNTLCVAIRETIKFDRVLLYKVEDSGAGKMLTESSNPNYQTFLGKQFSEDFMPQEVIDFYKGSTFRYCPNVHLEGSEFLEDTEDTNLFLCQLNPLPLLHLNYLKSIDVVSYIAVPILIDNRFWGMLIGHHHEEKTIDFQKRQLCAFIVQHAANKYAGYFKQQQLEYHDKIKEIELDLKGKLMCGKGINCTLIENLEILCKAPKADGIAVFHNGDIFTHGVCPTEMQILQIKQIVESINKKPVFKDSNFCLRYGPQIGSRLPFAGLMALQIANRNDYYIFWFRKESVRQILQVTPAFPPLSQSNEIHFKTWEETVRDSAIPWDDNDLYFTHRLSKLIHDTIVLKSEEQEKFNEELITLNNELEMLTFTLSHDLKNPLAIVKLGTQLIHKGVTAKDEEKQKWTRIILEGIQNIESIIDGLIHIGKTKSVKFAKDPVPMVHMLRKIVQNAKILYNTDRCNIEFGKLLPVWGEKSLVYQIFLNIVGNAIKYSSTQNTPLVQINSIQRGDCIYYQIVDNGIGIPREYLNNIFNVFTRANNTGKFPGTGVGLCLVKRIIEKLGGQISIDSEIGSGTTVTLSFPYPGEIPSSIYTG